MNTRIAAVALALAVGVGGIAVAPAASADDASSPQRPVTVNAAAFNASGVWDIFQSNRYTVRVNITQDSAGNLFGTASSAGSVGTLEAGALVNGITISFNIRWSNGARGRYEGSLGADRRLSGITFDLNKPSSQATWVTTRTF
ncbi:hypothetical protein [Streptomyces caelestis]|uniref:hypothetical protein n=1 Tax=Streptomyces caelestis TaxID=36816 RepID=UPI00365BAF54